MTENTSAPIPSTGARWFRRIAIAAAILVVLLVALYFVASSSAFVRSFILPKVGAALGGTATADSASLSPFSQVTLKNFKLVTTGPEPLFSAAELRVRYNLRSILGGVIELSELTVQSPAIHLVKEPDGNSNLEPVLRKLSESKSEEPTRLNISNISLQSGAIRIIQQQTGGGRDVTELTGLRVTVDRLANGQPGKVTVSSSLNLSQTAPAPGANSALGGTITGSFDYTLDPDLLPQTLKGAAEIAFNSAAGAYSDLNGIRAILDTDVSPTEIRQLALRFERNNQRLGQLQVRGPLDLSKSEARLAVEIQSIDRQVLNLAGAPAGIDFGATTLNATNLLDIAKAGSLIGMSGSVAARQVMLQKAGSSTPQVDLDVDYQVSLNTTDKTAVVQKLNISGRQNARELLTASLDRPMNLTWGEQVRGFTESQFRVAVKSLNLADWHAVAGTNLPAGKLDLQLGVLAKQDGKQLSATLLADLQELTLTIGTNRIQQARVLIESEGLLEQMKDLSVSRFQLDLFSGQTLAAQVNGSARYDLATRDATLQSNAELTLSTLLQQVPMPGLQASNGTLKISSRIAANRTGQNVTANVMLNDFTGSYGEYRFQNYQATVDAGVDMTEDAVKVSRLALRLNEGYEAGGSVDLSGNFNRKTSVADLTFHILDLNQFALRPFLAPSLGSNQLASISLKGSGSASHDPKGASRLKGDLEVSNWVVRDPAGALPKTPLSAKLSLDGGLQNEVLDLQNFVVALTPTAHAKNSVQLSGRLDLRLTNAAPSSLKLYSESLDLTHYYDMFAAKPAPNAPTPASKPARPTTPPAPAAAAAGAAAEQEPLPISLPVQNLTAEIEIGRFLLREIAVTNFQTVLHMQKDVVSIKPLQLTLNGAPVKGQATVNVGVPGYSYDLSFDADQVPIEPLANTFAVASAGQYKGDLIAHAQIKGAGMTGRSLQKNLAGQFTLSLTNLNLELVSPKTKSLLEPIALVLRVPEITQTPLNWIYANGQMSTGKVELSRFTVLSQAFTADSHGAIPIADVLTNSPLNLPVTLALRRSLADRAKLIPPEAPTNTVYVTLPSFVTVRGTLGQPETEINKIVISGLLLRSAGGLRKPGDETGNILEGIGGILSGEKPLSSVTNLIRGASEKPAASTNNAAGATNSVTNTNKPARLSPLDLLRLLPEKKSEKK